MAADLFAVVEMRVLLCWARGIFWRSSIAGREGETYAVDLPSQDRDKCLDPSRHAQIQLSPEKALAYFGMHRRYFPPRSMEPMVHSEEDSSEEEDN